jgi:hypothetical protein
MGFPGRDLPKNEGFRARHAIHGHRLQQETRRENLSEDSRWNLDGNRLAWTGFRNNWLPKIGVADRIALCRHIVGASRLLDRLAVWTVADQDGNSGLPLRGATADSGRIASEPPCRGAVHHDTQASVNRRALNSRNRWGKRMEGESGRLTVLIPVYNEQDLVEQVIDRVFRLGELIHEVIAVNDGSTDETRAALDRLNQQGAYGGRLRVIHMPRNQGKTSAIQQGLLEATGECVIIQDADLEYDPAEIPDVVGPILSGEADVVYGSRFLVRRAARVLYFYHYLANKFLTLLSNLLTNRNMTDIETGYKAFRREVIQPLRLTSKGFGMEVEITAMICKTRARTYEVPISYHGRTYEEGRRLAFAMEWPRFGISSTTTSCSLIGETGVSISAA